MIDLHNLSGKGSLYFVRHGQTEDHQPGLIKGLHDLPLSRGGIAQAEATGQWFSRIPTDIVLAGPLLRVRETAQIIASSIELPGSAPEIREIPELIEIDTGIFTGYTQEQAAEKFPAEYDGFLAESWEAVPGAEKIASLKTRVTKFWETVFTLVAAGKQNILSVIHKGIFQWIMRVCIDHGCWMPLFEIDFCGVYRLRYDRTGNQFFAIWDVLNFTAWQ